MSDLTSKFIAAAMLIFMLGIAYFSLLDDSAIMDEVAHLPAGYSYVLQGDMRLNPEHPPLIKDLAGMADVVWSQFSKNSINFPSNIKAWTQDVNGQWDFGFDFLYKEGNPADRLIFYGRLPILFILLLLGIYLFRWTKELWGKGAALLSLFLFSFSPTFIAHGRFVTTDVAAAAGFFIATYYFIRWLKNPKAWDLIPAGIFFGLAQLTKFSLFLLVPFFGVLLVLWIIIKAARSEEKIKTKTGLFGQPPEEIESEKGTTLRIIWRYISGFVLIMIIGYGLIVTPVYYFHVINYPAEKQIADMRYIMKSYGGGPDATPLASCTQISRITRCPAELTLWMAGKNTVLRSFGQYVFGLLMVVQRAVGGNTTYFMGEVSNSGWRSYFPTVYLLKEPLTLHILTLLAVIIFISRPLRKRLAHVEQIKQSFFKRAISWLNLNFEGIAMLFFIFFYWATSIRSPLNIGVRHVLPTFPFIFALVSSQIIFWLRSKKINAPQKEWDGAATRRRLNWFLSVPRENKIYFFSKFGLVGLLMAWQIFSVLAVYPHFLAYFNEIAGGPGNGYKFVADSNLDWGQDLKRLTKYAEQNNIDKIYVDYFGGGDARYYLGDKFQPWWGTKDPSDLQSGDWLAISATLLQGGRGKPAPGFTQPYGYYNWLDRYTPVTTIGYSIFVYQIP